MGGCQGNKVVEVNQSPQKGNNHNYQHGSKNAGSNINSRDEFPDMKEWKGERYSGIGIKRMKGYKCNLPIDKLNEKTVQWLINLFTHPSNELDDKTKILLKAITQTKFEFFEAFAENFKKTLYELINSSNKNKNWINKYVFKIIEKCLIKLPNIEKEFLVNLSKVCHSIIDVFVSKQNSKIKKLYRDNNL